jgi:hypothetical protein
VHKIMTKRVNLNTKNLRHVLSVGLAAAALAVVLTYALGAQAILQSPYAEPSHELFMSMGTPGPLSLLQFILGGASQSQQMHGGPASEESTMQGMSESQMQAGPHTGGPASEESTMEGMSESQMQGMRFGIIGNNILGSPAGLAAGGLAAVVVNSIIVLTAAAFVASWKQRSFVVAGLLAASGIILMILPLANMNFVFPGPIIGVVVGLVIFGLAVTKGIRTVKGIRTAGAATIASK